MINMWSSVNVGHIIISYRIVYKMPVLIGIVFYDEKTKDVNSLYDCLMSLSE